jgi:Animal haem peroxidase
MSGKHSGVVRGLLSTGASPLFQGKFGRMFRSLPAAKFGANENDNVTNLKKLGDAMSAAFDPPSDGKDPEESGIPALYTYLGQFIDHDITFDPASSLQQQNDPDALTDYRTPALDLDNVYGRGPDDQPYLYTAPPTGSSSVASHFLLGKPIQGGTVAATDLPRNGAEPARALIGDPRNDENSIVSQLHGLFLRFHNRKAEENPDLSFEVIQQLMRFHYQYLVLHDFLPRIVHSSVLSELKSGRDYDRKKLKFFHWRHEPFMPVEFSVAAYRLGHSMVRPGYRLNDATLLPICAVPPGFPDGLVGFQAMDSARGIDWGRFIDIDTRKYDGSDADKAKRLQFAYRIDTSLVNPLSALPPSVAINPSALAQRNLLRGWRLGLPSGQRVARAMGIEPIKDENIKIGQAVDVPDSPLLGIVDPKLGLGDVFKDNCPLWTYILAEAMHHKESVKVPVQEDISINTPKLGPVGGRIVAEVLLGMMFGDQNSLLNLDPKWQPASGPDFRLKDFVKYALGQ